MPDREVSLQRLLEVWNGTANLDDLDELVTPNYLGHIGSRDRDLRQLKEDIVAYRHRVDSVRFEMLHRFSEGEYVETRLVARGTSPETGLQLCGTGLNIGRWEKGLLAEEWAVWEPLSAAPRDVCL